MKKLKTVVAVVGFGFLVGVQAEPQWAWDAGKQTNNGAITIKSVSGGTTYSGTQNPTGAVAKTNQSAVTQPPTVIVQGSQCGFTHSTYSRIVSGSGTLNPPADAVAMRVAVIGGGGGGCAASNIVPASVITYVIGTGGAGATSPSSPTDGGNTTATFTGYSLVGGGGGSSTSLAPSGGSASGGDYNFSGGSGSYAANNSGSYGAAASGGGGAGPNGNGGNGVARNTAGYAFGNPGVYSGTGWGPGGGGSGFATGYTAGTALGGSGGGGTNSPGGGSYFSTTTGAIAKAPSDPWGTPGASAPSLAFKGYPGGEMGGGGGGCNSNWQRFTGWRGSRRLRRHGR